MSDPTDESKAAIHRWRAWCRLGFHDYRSDPEIPHTYRCQRRGCSAVHGGHL